VKYNLSGSCLKGGRVVDWVTRRERIKGGRTKTKNTNRAQRTGDEWPAVGLQRGGGLRKEMRRKKVAQK